MHWEQIKKNHEAQILERQESLALKARIAEASKDHAHIPSAKMAAETAFATDEFDLSPLPPMESTYKITLRREPQPKVNKAMFAMALAVGTPVTAYAVGDIRDIIEPIKSTAKSILPEAMVSQSLPPEISHCEGGMIFSGKKHDFVITNEKTCKRLLQAVPGIGQTKHYNASMKVTGMEDGSFAFRLKEDPDPIIVPRENYMAIIEAWLVSGGAKQDPVPLTFPFGKWRIESRLGTFIGPVGKKYCGMNQNGPAVLAQAFNEFGRDHGYDEQRLSVRRIGAKYGDLDYGKVASDSGFRAYFDQICREPVLSGVMGMRNSLKIAKKLQSKIDSGEIVLPNGRKSPSPADVYIAHLLGTGETIYAKDSKGREITSNVKARTGAVEFFHALATNPDAPMKSFIEPGAYASNDYFFETEIQATRRIVNIEEGFIKTEPVLDKNGNAVTVTHQYSSAEFYQRFAERWGFDSRGFPDLKNWKPAKYHPSGSAKVEATDGGKAEFYHPRRNMPELRVYKNDVNVTFNI